MKNSGFKSRWPKARVAAARKNLRRIIIDGKTLPSPIALPEKIQGLPIRKSDMSGSSRATRDMKIGYSLYVAMTLSGKFEQHVGALRKSMNIKRSDGEALTAIMRAVQQMPRDTALQARRADRSAAVSGMQVAHLINQNIPISKIAKLASTPGQSPTAWYLAERERRAEQAPKRAAGVRKRKSKAPNRSVSSLATGRKKKDRVLAELELLGSGRFRVVHSCSLPKLAKVKQRNARWLRISGSARK